MRKALLSAADAVIFDLEDSVAPQGKLAARSNIPPVLGEARDKPVFIRVNAADTQWHLEDLAAVVRAAPEGIMLPKCDGPDAFQEAAARLDVLEAAFALPSGSIRLLPLVTESAAALNSLNYRSAGPRLLGLGFAGEDLAADLGVNARRAGQLNPLLDQARRMVAIAAAAAAVPAFDTPWPVIKDPEGLGREAKAAADLGYSGKLLIHPAQAEMVNDIFTPSAETLHWAKSVVSAVATSENGVALLDGKMIDIAHLRLARRYLGHATSGS